MQSFDQLSSRERAMTIGLGSVFAALIVILVPLRVSAYLSGRQRYNDDLRQAITDVSNARARLAARRLALGDLTARYANKAPPLSNLIDPAAKAAGLEIAVQTDVPAVPRGKLYTERATRLSIQKTGLRAITTFLEKLESAGHPIAITQFDISKRIEADSYTVNLTVSAYDRNETPAAPTPGAPK